MKKLLLAIPVLIDRENRLTKCLTAAFKQTMVQNGDADIYVISNNPNDQSLVEQIDQFDDGYLIVNDDNLGVSGSWNQAMIEAKKNDYEYTCCIGFDTVFKDNLLLEDFVKEMKSSGSIFGRGKSMSFNFWMVETVRFLDNVGSYDENFYPAYWEDIDMMRRLRMARDKGYIKTLKYNDSGRMVHSQSRTVNDHEEIIPHDVWNYTYTQNQLYIRNKWGTDQDNHNVGYANPFGELKFHNSFWVLDHKRYERNKQKWDNCLNQ